jgi:hypothetical protein
MHNYKLIFLDLMMLSHNAILGGERVVVVVVVVVVAVVSF